MPFRFLRRHDNAIGLRVYPLLQLAYDTIHKEPALAGLRIRQALEEIGRYRLWTKHGYPLREDDEPYHVHRQAHSIYQRTSSLLHIETIDPFDDEMVRRTARLQLRRMHALALTLYPQRGVHFVPPKALIEQDRQEGSDFEGLQEEIDDLDDNVSGEDEMFIQMSDEEFEATKVTITQKINKNDSLAKWERTLLLFELDLAQVGWDLRKRQYEDNISKDGQRRIKTLLASGRRQALPTIYEYYRRRQESALNDFFFERAYEESKSLLEQFSAKENSLSEINLTSLRNPLRGRVLSTFGRIVAIHAHSYEAVGELDRARQLFSQAERELVDPEDRAQQQLFIVHTLLEKKRIDPTSDIDTEIDAHIDGLDKHIERFIDGTPTQDIVRIDLRIVCRLKIAMLRGEKYNHLTRLSTRIAQEVCDVENHLHHPWEQVCGLVHALQPHNTPKEIRAVLEECAKIPQDAKNSLLGLIARGYLLEGRYRRDGSISEKDQQAFIQSLPADAKSWWDQYDIASRFVSRCAKDSAGSPIDVFPFDMA